MTETENESQKATTGHTAWPTAEAKVATKTPKSQEENLTDRFSASNGYATQTSGRTTGLSRHEGLPWRDAFRPAKMPSSIDHQDVSNHRPRRIVGDCF